MHIIHNPLHHLHQGRHEMFRGRLVACHEVADRLDHVLAELQARPMGNMQTPADVSPAALRPALEQIHSPRYLDFLAHAWDEWVALDPANAELDALPSVWPGHGLRHDMLPANFAARLGLFSFDAGTPLTSGSWRAACGGAACAIAAATQVADRVDGAGTSLARSPGAAASAFALSRPPGHHAGTDFFGGYCFLNNAALAAQTLRTRGFERVAVLDVDYHHGNGTQQIFEARADVLTVSIHGDPNTEYPFFLGHADERGIGAGTGFNLNLPLPRGTDFTRWHAALHTGLAEVRRFGAQALVVPLGVDTFAGDPISGFTLQSADYLRIGETIASAGLPTVFVFEGGYAVAEVGINVVNVLEGFQA